MRRVCMSIDDDLAEQFDQLIRELDYGSRSEAYRELLRWALNEKTPEHSRSKSWAGVFNLLAGRAPTQQGHDVEA